MRSPGGFDVRHRDAVFAVRTVRKRGCASHGPRRPERTRGCLAGAIGVVVTTILGTPTRAHADPQPPAAHRLTKEPRLVRFVEADYPAVERDAGTSATVVLALRIGADGAVEDATVTDSGGASFDEAAVAAAKQFVFEPAEIDGKPARIRILYRYAFTIREPEPAPVETPPPPPPTLLAQPAAQDGDDLEIVVRAPPSEHPPVATAVSAAEARRLPGTQGDVLKVVENLPGVARSQVGSGQLVVWGAAPEDTRVYVDGVRIPRLYHDGGVRSVLGSDFVRSVTLLPGGYGAAYGRGLGGLVRVETLALSDEPFHASAALDLLDASVAARVPIGDRVHVAIAGRRSHLDTVIDAATSRDPSELFPVPHYADLQARVDVTLGPREHVDLTGLLSSDDVTRDVSGSDPSLVRSDRRVNAFQRIYARYERHLDGGGRVVVTPWYGHDYARQSYRFGETPTSIAQDTDLFGLRASYRGRAAEHVVVEVGLDMEASSASVARSGSMGSPPREGDARVFGEPPSDRINADAWKVVGVGLAPYAEVDVGLFGDRVHVVPGVRFDPYFSSVSRRTPIVGDTPSVGLNRQDAAVDPRLAVRWAATPILDVRAAVGLYRQPPQEADRSAVFGNPDLPTARAAHALAGTRVAVGASASLETTAFVTSSEGLAVRNPSASPLLAEALVPAGEGHSHGVQFLFRKERVERFSGWLSWTISRSERRDGPGLSSRPFDYDQSHVAAAVGSYDLGRGFEVGLRARYATGFPRAPVVGAYQDARTDAYVPIFGPKNRERLPSFFQIDLRGSKSWKLPTGTLEAYLEVLNVTARENPEERVYNANYTQRGYILGLPILPVAGVRWFL